MAGGLYNHDILRLAASLVTADVMEPCDAAGDARSPLCGSRIRMQVRLDAQGRVAELAMQVNACAVGQASATILQRYATGAGQAEIAALRDGLAAFLAGKGDLPDKWPELQTLSVAQSYRARHAALLLPYDALLQAFATAGEMAG